MNKLAKAAHERIERQMYEAKNSITYLIYVFFIKIISNIWTIFGTK